MEVFNSLCMAIIGLTGVTYGLATSTFLLLSTRSVSGSRHLLISMISRYILCTAILQTQLPTRTQTVREKVFWDQTQHGTIKCCMLAVCS